MIRLEMVLIPYGQPLLGAADRITAQFFTLPRNTVHGFRILRNDGTMLAEGEVPKTRSGHRNPLHLLRDVLAMIDFDALGENYVTTRWDGTTSQS